MDMRVSNEIRDRLFKIYHSKFSESNDPKEESCLLLESARKDLEQIDGLVEKIQKGKVRLSRSERRDAFRDKNAIGFLVKYLESLNGASPEEIARALRPLKHIGFFN